MFEKRKQRKLEAAAKAEAAKKASDALAAKLKREEKYKAAFAKWEEDIDEIEQEIAMCDGAVGGPIDELILKQGERVFASIQKIDLLESRSVQGYPEMVETDTGKLHITNQRIVFQGESKTLESLFSKLVGVQYLKEEVVVSVTNRQKATTVKINNDVIPLVKRRVDLALAAFHDKLDEHKVLLESELAELLSNKPKAPRGFDESSTPKP